MLTSCAAFCFAADCCNVITSQRFQCCGWSFQVNLKSGTNILYWRTGGVLMGSKVLKPVFLRNIQIEGQEWYFLLFEHILFPFYRFASSQVSPTHRSVFLAKLEHSAAPRARPRAFPALATPTLVTAPAPAPPATPPLSMQVRAPEVHRLHEQMELKCHQRCARSRLHLRF